MDTMIPTQQLPLNIVGSNVFGRYPKISVEQTFNMIISDQWLVPYAGYKKVVDIVNISEGRGIFSSVRWQHMIVVIDNGVYAIDTNLLVTLVATIATTTGDVFIDENEKSEIAISDGLNIYIFNYVSNTFNIAPILFIPGYICYQNARFIVAATETGPNSGSSWRLSNPDNSLDWPFDGSHVGLFETKPDSVIGVVRFPGRGDLLLIIGKTVIEFWYDVGAPTFPYQRNNSQNIDYGCLNPATIATNEKYIVWLGSNEKSGPVIMYTEGGDVQQISTDGINFLFSQLNNPENAYGFLFKQDGHLFYQLTFPLDNLTLVYDFITQKFFTLTDENLNFHIAKRLCFFNGTYYFVSFTTGDVYEISTNYTNYDGNEIPRIRICSNVRLPDQSRFIINSVGFTVEQGTSEDLQKIDLSISKDGGETFGNVVEHPLNALGKFKNRFIYWKLGAANDAVIQLRFWGKGRFVATDGIVSISK